MKKWILLLIGTMVLLMVGCVTGEKQIKQTSLEEQEIFQLFSEMQSAWNKQDTDTYITFWHPDLRLKLGTPQKPKYFSKAEYAKVLPQRMADFGPYKMVNPKILKIEGDNAKVKVTIRKSHRDYKNIFNLLREDGRWRIVSNEW